MDNRNEAGESEITLRMLEAGSVEYRDWQHDNWERSAPNCVANLVARVYRAMEEASRPSVAQGRKRRAKAA